MFAARRPCAVPLAARRPARARRADPRHGTRAVALLRRHHDPHLRAPGRRGAGAVCARAGHQRAHRPAPPVPGARRPAHGARAARPSIADKRYAWIGDGNNMANSWINAGLSLRLRPRARVPGGLRPRITASRACAEAGGRRSRSSVTRTRPPRGAHVVTTDVWASMGQEQEQEKREQRVRRLHRDARR